MITIGIVLYNEEKRFSLLEKNLRLLCRSPRNFAVIAVDNASTDKTGELLRGLDGSIRVFSRAENNLGAARQNVVDAAETEWVGFIDGDCLVDENWIFTAVVGAGRMPENVAAFGGPWIPAGASRRDYEALFSSPVGNFSLPQLNRDGAEIPVRHIPTANVIYRKRDVLAAGGFQSRFRFVGEDLDLSLRLRANGKQILMLPLMPVKHFLPESISGWTRKIFTYGRGRVRVAWEHKAFADRILILPVLFLAAILASVVTGNLWVVAAYAIAMAGVAILCAKESTPHSVWAFIVATHFSYALGMAYEWLTLCLPFAEVKKRFDRRLETPREAVGTASFAPYYLERKRNR